MQQDNERQRMEEEMKQQQDRRSKPMQAENHQQPQQPQKCPRCESLNTKFCYYNNYSLSQPRYFCKTCRRYWTQGGTLRNVPVGGGCRKGKRTKTSNSGDNSRSQLSPAPLIQQQGQQNMGTAVPTLIKEASNLASPPQAPPPAMSSYYSGGGFLSSLAVIQSLNQNPQGFNQSINVGGGKFGGSSSASSNMALLQGFNVPTFSSQQHHHQQQQQQMQQNELIFQMGNREKNVEPLFPSQENWNHPNLINTTNNPSPSEAGLWNINSSSSNTTSNSNSSTVGASMNPYQWPDLPGYGPPP